MPLHGPGEVAILLGLAGNRVFRSRSPLVFRALFEASGRRGAYLRLAARDAAEAMDLFRGLGLAGMDLCPSLRESMLPFLDGLEGDATAGGAVDFLRRAGDGRILGGSLGIPRGAPASTFAARGVAEHGAAARSTAALPDVDAALLAHALQSWERLTGVVVPGAALERATRALAAARAGAGRPGIALVGLMGSGKSSAGSILAALLGLPFVDSDAVIEGDAGMPVARIFALEGEGGFRARETRILERITRGPPCVLAAGGGLPLSAVNRGLLAASFETVWLQVSPETAARRVGGGDGRPLLEGRDALSVLRSLGKERQMAYASVADLVVAAEDEGPATTAGRIHDEIR